jgi:Tol biopolymer transport system component/uncharacterized protein YjdB
MSIRRAGASSMLVLAAILGACSDDPVDPTKQIATVQVTPATAAVTALGRTVSFSAQTLNASGAPVSGLRVIWTSSAPSIATVDSAGFVTAMAAGEAIIAARVGTISGSASITVTQVPAVVEVGAAADTLRAIGAQRVLTAVVRDSGSTDITGAAIGWASSDTTVVHVSATGVATAVAEGAATITAESGGVTGARTVVVHQVVSSVAVTPPEETATRFGQQITYAATARDSLGAVVTGRGVEWTSSEAAVASVSVAGLATVLTNGTTMISATIDGEAGTATLQVDVRGALRITVQVSGGGADADGFTAHVADATFQVDADAVVVDQLLPGQVAVSLAGLGPHCKGLRDRTSATVVPGDTLEVEFSVRCVGDYAYDTFNLDFSRDLHIVDRYGVDTLLAQDVVEGSWAWSPDGSRIAWSNAVNGNVDLYVAKADGSEKIRLTNHPDDDTQPGWSPDGQFIVFRTGPDIGASKLMITVVDGTGMRPLIENLDNSLREPRWSPRGDLIAFSRLDGSYGVWLIAPDGTGARRVSTPGVWSWKAEWLPDGEWFAYEAWYGASTFRVMRHDGTGDRHVATGGHSETSPRLSSDGSNFTFMKSEGFGDVAVVNSDGTGEQVFALGFPALYPTWTADGSSIMFSARSQGMPLLGVMSPDGHDLQLVPGTTGVVRAAARPR